MPFYDFDLVLFTLIKDEYTMVQCACGTPSSARPRSEDCILPSS